MVKNAPQTTYTLTAGDFHKQYLLSTTDTCSHTAAFLPFLSSFCTGGCRW